MVARSHMTPLAHVPARFLAAASFALLLAIALTFGADFAHAEGDAESGQAETTESASSEPAAEQGEPTTSAESTEQVDASESAEQDGAASPSEPDSQAEADESAEASDSAASANSNAATQAEESSESAESAESAASAESSSSSASSGSSSSQRSAQSEDAEDEESELENLLDPTQRADNSFIYDTTIESLFDQASLYDGNTVQVVGEVVGDRLKTEGTLTSKRKLYWIMLTSLDADNKSSISVQISGEQAKQIDHYGRYGVTGTTLQVRGMYHQACAEHQGLPDIHATNCSAIARGVEHPDTFEAGDFAPALLAVLVGLALLGIYYLARERSR